MNKKVVNNDIVRLEYLINLANNSINKLDKFWVRLAGNNIKFIKYIDVYLPAFKQNSINSTRPNAIGPNNVFKDIDMQHIMDKHTLEHFDFNNPQNFGSTVDMFPIGTTQQQVCDYIDETLNWLSTAINKGPNYPLDGTPEIVTLLNQYIVQIGSRTENNLRIIGQFFPQSNSNLGIETFSSNELEALSDILK